MSAEIKWPASPRTKHCASCGVGYSCGPVSGAEHCWCNELPHVALNTKYEDCLCPACLDREITKAQIHKK